MERYRTWPDKPAEKPRVSILHESRQALIVSHNCKRDAAILKKAADVSADADRFAAAEAEAEEDAATTDDGTTDDDEEAEGEHASDDGDPTNNSTYLYKNPLLSLFESDMNI